METSSQRFFTKFLVKKIIFARWEVFGNLKKKLSITKPLAADKGFYRTAPATLGLLRLLCILF